MGGRKPAGAPRERSGARPPTVPAPERLLAHPLTRGQFLRRAGLGGAALLAPPVLAGCGGDEGSTSGGGADAFRMVVPETVPQLDIVSHFTGPVIGATRIGVESLVTYDAHNALEPLLAERWEQTDELTYVYTIRQGVTFWDGSQLTAADVVASLQRHLDPAAKTHFYWASVAAVEQTADLEVTVTLQQPDVFFQYVPVLAGILPKAFIDAHGDGIGTPEVGTMGTGPYQVEEYAPDSGITWVRREDGYWGKPPPVREITLTVVEEPATQLLAVRSGEVDAASFSPTQAAEWEAVEGVNVSFSPDLVTMFFSFDLEAAPWNDVHVRRAVAHALDREGLVKALFDGHAVPATTVVPPAQWGALASQEEVERIYAELPTYAFDLELAREELRQSSVPDGFKATAAVSTAFPEYGKIALSLQENLRQLGIELTINELQDEQHQENRFAHADLGLRLDEIGADYPDPANFLSLMLDSGGAVKDGWNTANYANPEVDRLLVEQASSPDPEVRRPLLVELLRTAAEDLPYLGIYHPVLGFAAREGFDVQMSGLSVYKSLGQRVSVS